MTAGWWVAIALYFLGMQMANPYIRWVDDYTGSTKDTKFYPSIMFLWPATVIFGLTVIMYSALAALEEKRAKQ